MSEHPALQIILAEFYNYLNLSFHCPPLLHPMRFILPFLCLTMAAHAVPPTVSNIRASQKPGTKLVEVYYDLADPDSASVSIQLEASSNSGQSFDLPIRSLSGQVGASVVPGANRRLIWDAGSDWNGNFSANCRVRIWAQDGTLPVPPSGMAHIPSGTFVMGWESPTVTGGNVTLTKSFFMDRYEVSGALWASVADWGTQNGYDAFGGSSNGAHPAHTMTWFSAARWCNARSQKEGLTPCYYTESGLTTVWKTGTVAPFVKWNANGYRLPTETEWERAARGGLDRKLYPWGDTIANHQANYSGSGDPFESISPPTTPVGYYNGAQTPAGVNMANGYGLYDMAGNVWEWCWDWLGAVPWGQTDPAGPATGSARLLRGGAWGNTSVNLRCSVRGSAAPTDAGSGVGFRCVRGL